MTTMESLIGLVNRIQRACTVLGDYGGGDNTFSSLWEALPSVAVVGGQVFSLKLLLLLLKSWFWRLLFNKICFVLIEIRVLESRRFWRVSSGEIFFQEDQVFGDFCFGFYMSSTFCYSFCCGLRGVDHGDLQVLSRGGLWCCSCTRPKVDNRSMRNSFTCQNGDSLILVCTSHLSSFAFEKY